jgi:hypothetical protein
LFKFTGLQKFKVLHFFRLLFIYWIVAAFFVILPFSIFVELSKHGLGFYSVIFGFLCCLFYFIFNFKSESDFFHNSQIPVQYAFSYDRTFNRYYNQFRHACPSFTERFLPAPERYSLLFDNSVGYDTFFCEPKKICFFIFNKITPETIKWSADAQVEFFKHLLLSTECSLSCLFPKNYYLYTNKETVLSLKVQAHDFILNQAPQADWHLFLQELLAPSYISSQF